MVVITLLSLQVAKAQSNHISVFGVVLPNSALEGGKIKYTNLDQVTAVSGSLTFIKNIPDSLECNVQAIFMLRNPAGVESAISDSIKVNNLEFRSQVSIPKNYTFRLQPNNKAGTVYLRFRYYRKNYPASSNGWTGMNSGGSWETVDANIPPPTTFSGPNQICAEGIYTLTNPGTITLENTNGIATLTALGNNQWKVTRIGTANGLVTLKSTDQQNTVTSKPIEIGILAPTTIFGPNSVTYNSTYTFSSGDLDPNITYYWTVTNAPAGTNIIGGTTNKSFTISLPPKTSSLPENGTLLISVRRSGACSGSSDSFVKQIPYTTSSGGGKPPIQIP